MEGESGTRGEGHRAREDADLVATETMATVGAPGAAPGIATETAGGLGARDERVLPRGMRPSSPSLKQAHLMGALGAASTGVSQNGVTVLANTAGAIRSLDGPPERVKVTPAWPERFITLAKWVGRVQRVHGDSFVAIVQDQLSDSPDEEVELARSEVSEADEPLLRPGAVFYWSIGYRELLGRQRWRESAIRFRRLPKPSIVDEAEATAWVTSIRALIASE